MGTLLRFQVVIFDLMLLHSASNVITNTPRHVLFSSESEPLPSPSALAAPLTSLWAWAKRSTGQAVG